MDSPSNVPGAPGVIQTAASLATSQEEDASTDDDVEDLIRPAAATIFSEAPPGPLPEDEVSREDKNLLKYFIMLQPKGATATTLAKVCTALYSGGGQSFKDYSSHVLGFSNTQYRKIFTLHERNTLEAGTDWQTFDITFLYKLLQWVHGLAPPSDKKWTEPMASGVDEELEYRLYRIKCERNFLAHDGVTLSNKELQERSSLKTLLENILCKVGQRKNIDLSQDVKTARIKLDEILNSAVLGNPGGAPTWPVSSSGRPVMIVNPNQPGLIQDGLIGKVQQPGIPNLDISTSLPSIQQQQPMPGPSVPGAQTPAQGMNMTNQRTVVWQGTLEWQEKKYDNNSSGSPGIGGGQQMPPLTVMQGMGQPGQGNVNVPLGNPGQNVLQPRTPLGMQQQQMDQEKMQILQIRQSQQHTQAISQQLQQQLQHKPGIANVSMNISQQGTGANTCPTMGQPRMLQPSMQNPGLRQLLQQQARLQQQQQQVQHQQQHPQQQQILMMPQQGIRPQLTQQGQQVMGQPLNQQNMGQPTQAMNPQGIGQSIQDSTDYMVDLL